MPDCNLYIDCNKSTMSWEQLFRLLTGVSSGCPALRVIVSSAGGNLELREDSSFELREDGGVEILEV